MAPKKRKLATGVGQAVIEAKTATKTKKHRKANTVSDDQKVRRVTRGMTRRDAIQAVFNTAELLENIFLFLPVKDIFRSMRVSRQFRDIVTTSTPIHRALFHHSNNQDAVTWILQRSKSVAMIPRIGRNIILREGFEYVRTEGEATKTWNHTVTALHPLLRLDNSIILMHYHTLSFHREPRGDVVVSFSHPIRFTDEFSPLWTSMHIMCPPVVGEVRLRFQWGLLENTAESGSGTVLANNPKGITFGDVLSAVKKSINSIRGLHEGLATNDRRIGDGILGTAAGQHGRHTTGTVIIRDIKISVTGVAVPTDYQLSQMESTGRAKAEQRYL